MTLSFNKLNEIAALYESIAVSEQEQLDEGTADDGVATRKAIGSATNTVKNQTVKGLNAAGDLTGAYYQGFAGQKTTSKDPIARASNAVTRAVSSPVRDAGNFVKGLVTGQGDKAPKPAVEDPKPASQQAKQEYAASKGKYYSSSDQKTYGSEAEAKSARAGRLKDLAAKQQASRGDSGGNTRPPANAKVLPSKPTGSAMDQWAKANPKLAAAKAERDRTRGTSATTNPLMKDMKSNLPAPAPKPAASSTLKSATDAASKPSAFKPATTAVASSTTDKGVVPASNAIAAAPKPKPMTPTRMPLAQSFEYDAYDLVLEYLLSQGHAETVAEAQYLMTEMDAEMIGDIVEARMDPRGRPASGPMNVYAKSKGKPDQAHLDAVKAYDEKQKKKTPEQRKKELDAYKERQRNR